LLLNNRCRYDTREAPEATMTEYPSPSGTRFCAASGRQLRAGEQYFGVVAIKDDRFVRQDYSPEAWTGAPADAFGYWVGRVPDAGMSARPPMDDDMLLECFQRLEGATEPAKVQFRYVVGLLLMRRKRLRFEEVVKEESSETLLLRDVRSGAKVRLADPALTDEQMKAVQDEVVQVLGWN
jgi:hypothetical protein